MSLERKLTYVYNFAHYKCNFVGEIVKAKIAHVKSRCILSYADNYPLKGSID